MHETVSAIGETLRRERTHRGLTPEEAAEAVDLPTPTVVGLESATLPLDAVGPRASLRIYARSLGVDAETLLRRLEDGDRSAPHQAAPVGAERAASPPGASSGAGVTSRPQWPALVGVAVLGAMLSVAGVLWWAPHSADDSTVALTAPGPTADGGDADTPGDDGVDGDAPGDAATGAAIVPSPSQDGAGEPVEELLPMLARRRRPGSSCCTTAWPPRRWPT